MSCWCWCRPENLSDSDDKTKKNDMRQRYRKQGTPIMQMLSLGDVIVVWLDGIKKVVALINAARVRLERLVQLIQDGLHAEFSSPDAAPLLGSSNTPVSVKNPRTLLTLLTAVFGAPTPPAFGELPCVLLPLPTLIISTLPDASSRIVLAA